MKKRRYFVEHVLTAVSRHTLGASVTNLCSNLGIAEGTFYGWKKEYASLKSSVVRELKQLKEENDRLKTLAATSVLSSLNPKSLRCCLFLLLILLLAASHDLAAAERVALILGNSAYSVSGSKSGVY